MKKGQQINMHFRAAGVSSTEKVRVIQFDTDTVTIEKTWHSDASGEEENGKFCRKTGKCMNDNTAMNSKRYIDPQ